MDHCFPERSVRAIVLAFILVLTGCAASNRPPQTVSDDTRTRLAKALMAAGDPVNAAEALRSPAMRQEQAPDQLMNVQLLIGLGKVDAALSMAQAALAAHGDDPEFALDMASILVKANRLSEAYEIYLDILRLHPQNVDALNGEGVVQAQEGDLTRAAISLRRALLLEPKNVPARNNLALVLLLNRQSDGALSLSQELAQPNPKRAADTPVNLMPAQPFASAPVPPVKSMPTMPLARVPSAPIVPPAPMVPAARVSSTPIVSPPPMMPVAQVPSTPVVPPAPTPPATRVSSMPVVSPPPMMPVVQVPSMPVVSPAPMTPAARVSSALSCLLRRRCSPR